MTATPPMLRAIDHVQLAIPRGGEDVARAYWVGVFGLVELPKPPAPAKRGGCWFIATGGHVQVHVGIEDPFAPAQKAHPAFRVGDLDALEATLAAAGHTVQWSDDVPGTRRFHTNDPFGNRLEFC